MSRRAEQMHRTLAALGASVTSELTAPGWSDQKVDHYGVATLTRESHEGVIASLELDRMWTSVSDTLPVEIGVWLGVGYAPALALMPVLTLRPTVALVNAAGPSNAPGQTFVLSGLADVQATTNQVVAFVKQHAMGFAEQFLDAAALAATMRRELDSGGDDRPDEDVVDSTARYLTLLAAMGRHSEARTLLAEFPPGQDLASADPVDRRFARQLSRWLDAGGPSPDASAGV